MATPALLPLGRLILFSPNAANLLSTTASSLSPSYQTANPLILDEKTISFYREGLLLPLYRRSDSWAEFRYSEGSMAIILKAVDSLNVNKTNGNSNYTNYEGINEHIDDDVYSSYHPPILDFICQPSNPTTTLMSVLSRCLTTGGKLQGGVKHNAFGSVCCVSDPSGWNRIGLFEPNE